ncbi:putative quinol monooxygenase [Kamptonema formosum]|uniref:putative quinol monooxygenase n=1 Tax=Kamptonema formosum TaxID=331992 RepID=UPI00034CF92D|nr:putative quinol monooxygenase [Oscillatoria sp. PCC 10802]
MSDTEVRVVARVVALPEKLEEVKAIVTGLVEPTRKEAGCISYEVLQNQNDATDFTVVEAWESRELLDAHLNSPHLQEAGAQLNGITAAAPDIRFYTLIA